MDAETQIKYYTPMITSLAEVFMEFNPSLVDECISDAFYRLRNLKRKVSEGYIHRTVKSAAIDIIRRETGLRATTLLIKKNDINDWGWLTAIIDGTDNSQNVFFRSLHDEIEGVCFGGLDRNEIMRAASGI